MLVFLLAVTVAPDESAKTYYLADRFTQGGQLGGRKSIFWGEHHHEEACQSLTSAVNELSLILQRQQHNLKIGVRIQNNVLAYDEFAQERQVQLF